MAVDPFIKRHPWDSRFWALFLVSAWGIALIGFWPPASQRFAGQADYPAPSVLVLHVFVYTGWLVLLTLQAWLVAAGRIAWHRRLGRAGAFLAILVPVTGLGAEHYSQVFYVSRDPENLRFFIIPLFMVTGFSVFAALALAARREAPRHKRAIYLATAFILTGAFSRACGDSLFALAGGGPLGTAAQWLTGFNLLLAALVAFDWVTRRMVYPLVKVMLIVAVPLEVGVIAVWYSDWWPGLVRLMLGIPPA